MTSVRLLQFTDTHLLTDPAGRLRGATTLPRLQACIAHARRRFFPADAIAVTGDLVHDEPAAYGTLELLFDGLGAPVLLIPGNHDLPDELSRRLSRAPFQVGGRHAAGAWRIVLLDTWFEASGNGEGRLGDAQLRSLDETLRDCGEAHVLVLLHHPPILMDAPGMDELGLVDSAAFMSVIRQHPQVRALAWGHAHQSLDVFDGARRLMCTPATCMQFRPRSAGFIVDDRPPGYRVLDLMPDGSIATEVVWLEGYRD